MKTVLYFFRKHVKMKLLIILVSVAAVYGAAVENCHLERLSSCADAVSDYRKQMGQSFPVTEEQVNGLCEAMKTSKQCAEDYEKKCMSPMQIETMGFLVEGAEQAYKDFCSAGSETRTNYLKHAQCLDESSKTEEAKSHYEYTEAALETLNEVPPEKKLTTACCGYQYMASKSEEMSREKCGQEAVDSFNKVVDMVVSSLPSVFCTGFEPTSSQCQAALPPFGTKPKGTLKNSHIAQTFASIYLPDIKQ